MGRRKPGKRRGKHPQPPRADDAGGDQEEAYSGEAEDDVFEVEGVMHEGEMVLVDKRSNCVYACERGPSGELVQVRSAAGGGEEGAGGATTVDGL